jgi:DNA-directed RNA polymerase subunit K/omega
MIQYPDDLKSKFKFVTLSSLRCDQLQKGAKARVIASSPKYTTVAQEEVLAGEVRAMTEEEIAAAQDAATTDIEPVEAPRAEAGTLEARS